MKKQNQIKMKIKENIDSVKALLAKDSGLTRSELAIEVCEQFDFKDIQGRLQTSSCLKALRDIESPSTYRLPPPLRAGPSRKTFRRLECAVKKAENVPERVDLINTLVISLVESEAEYRIWNELMIREHPQGKRPLVGRQLRYLVNSEHGYLGAVGFGSASLNLADREKWIGWNNEQKNSHLDKIVCMSRFLIRPCVRCKNLASKVLSMVTNVLAGDFREKYGYSPWLLESFVDSENYKGTCYKAANWLHVGQSKGRGRQDKENACSETIKDIYVFVLDKNFRDYTGARKVEKYKAVNIFEGLDNASWATQEFGEAPLGDKRLNQRLVSIATQRGNMPESSFLESAKGNEAQIKGFYRFIEKPNDSAVTMENILQPHQERTLARINNEKEVLCIHDTTDLNFNTLDCCEGLGAIGKNQSSSSKGLRLHSSLAVTEKGGLPLGVLNAECYAPAIKKTHEKRKTAYTPIQEKESYRWIKAIDNCMTQIKKIPDAKLVHVMDREADFFDLFHFWNSNKKNNELIVRAQYNRKTNDGNSIFDLAKDSDLKGTYKVDVQRKTARKKKGKKPATPARNARTANLEIRYIKTQIEAPKSGLNKGKESIDVWLIHALEDSPPKDGSSQIEWFLLTTIQINNIQDAQRIIAIYAKRWRIEDWHKILKSGCKIEELLYEEAERLKRMAAINMVIAWRIMLMTLIGRHEPESPAEALFSDTEISVLKCIAQKEKLPFPENAGKAVFIIAKLGGYIGRKNDGPPGYIVLWRGFISFLKMCEGYVLFNKE